MYCTNCGKEVASGVKFCGNCGTKQVGTADSIQANNELPAAVPLASQSTPMPNIKPPAVYAGFWKRVGAYLIDAVVIGVVAFLVAFWYSSGNPVGGPDAKGRTQDIGMLIGFGVTWLYFSLMEASATVGKRVFDLKVAKLDGRPLSQTGVSCLWRGFVKTFVVPFTISIGFLISLFTPRKQALHDILAGTVVVNASATPKEISASEPRNSLMTNKVAVALSLMIAIVPILAAIALPAYQDYTTRARLAGSKPFDKFDPPRPGHFEDGKPDLGTKSAKDFLNEGLPTENWDSIGRKPEDTKHSSSIKPFPDGQNTLTLTDGTKYIGEFKDGKLNGQGTQTLPNADKYFGEFKDNNRHGQGTYTWSNGNKYVGEFRDGKQQGKGTFTLPNGEKYVGESKDNEFNGQGTYTWSNGQKYVGEFKDGNRHGQGTTYSADGTILQSGSYENNVFVRGR